MHCHPGDDDEDVLIAEFGDGLAQTVMLGGVFCVEEGDLDNGNV